jgi:very-short-patch-repair endonuclease
MPPAPHRPRPLQWRVFRGSDAVAQNLLTVHQLRSSAWVRVRHDLYADARLDRDHGLACQAVALWLPPGAGIAGPSAAYLHGVKHAAGFADDVHVITTPERRLEPQRGVRVHHTRIDEAELATVGGPARTTPLRTAWDLANWLDLVSAVTVIDGLLGRGLVDPAQLRALLAARPGQRGSRRAERAFALADGRAQSPQESRLRVRLELAGLPRAVPQHPVRVDRTLVYHPDLAWPRYEVAIEYDGEWHATPEQLHRDRRRLNRLVAAGWLVLHATSRRLHREFPGVVREARDALRSRGWRGRHARD